MKRISPRILIATLGLMSVSVGLAVHAANQSDDADSSDDIPIVSPSQMDYDPFAKLEPTAPKPASPSRTFEVEALPPVQAAESRPTALPSPEPTEPARRVATLRDPSQFIPADQRNTDGVVRFPSVTPAAPAVAAAANASDENQPTVATRDLRAPIQDATQPADRVASRAGDSFQRLPAPDSSTRRRDRESSNDSPSVQLAERQPNGLNLPQDARLPQPGANPLGLMPLPSVENNTPGLARSDADRPNADRPNSVQPRSRPATVQPATIPSATLQADIVRPTRTQPAITVPSEPIPTRVEQVAADRLPPALTPAEFAARNRGESADSGIAANSVPESRTPTRVRSQDIPAIDIQITASEMERDYHPTVVQASGIETEKDPFTLAALNVREGSETTIDQLRGNTTNSAGRRRTGTLYKRFPRIAPAAQDESSSRTMTANRPSTMDSPNRVVPAAPIEAAENALAENPAVNDEVAPVVNTEPTPTLPTREELVAQMAQPAHVEELDSSLASSNNDQAADATQQALITAAPMPAQPATAPPEPVEQVAVPYQPIPTQTQSFAAAQSDGMQLTGPSTQPTNQTIQPVSRIPDFASVDSQATNTDPNQGRNDAQQAVAWNHGEEDASQLANTVQFQDSPSDWRVGQRAAAPPSSNFSPEVEYSTPISNQDEFVPYQENAIPNLPSAEDLAGAPLEEELLSDPFMAGANCTTGCGQKYYYAADLIAYQPSLPSIQISNAVATDNANFREGARFRFGYRGDCLVGWEASLTQLSHASEIGSSTTSGLSGTLTTRWIPTGGFTGASLSSFNSPTAQVHLQKHRFEFTDFEFNRMTWGWDVLNTQFGLRVTKFRENLFFGSGPSNLAIENMPGQFRQDISNTLVGPQVGMTLIDDSRRSLTFDMRGKAGIYVNFMDKDTLFANNGQVLLNATNTQDVKFAVSGEFGTGLSWHLSPNLKIRAGFDALYWYGVGTIRDQQIPAPAPNLGGLVLTGGMGSLINNEDDILLWGGTIGLYGNWP